MRPCRVPTLGGPWAYAESRVELKTALESGLKGHSICGSPDYESKVVPKFRPIAERLAALAGPEPGDLVLELGAGTGGLSRLVVPRIEPGGHMVLLDISTGMLEVATRALRDAGYENATCVVHDLASLPFLGEQFDLVLCNLGY